MQPILNLTASRCSVDVPPQRAQMCPHSHISMAHTSRGVAPTCPCTPGLATPGPTANSGCCNACATNAVRHTPPYLCVHRRLATARCPASLRGATKSIFQVLSLRAEPGGVADQARDVVRSQDQVRDVVRSQDQVHDVVRSQDQVRDGVRSQD